MIDRQEAGRKLSDWDRQAYARQEFIPMFFQRRVPNSTVLLGPREKTTDDFVGES